MELDILLLSIALAMDAFAVAITLGISGLTKRIEDRVKVGLTFGLFQALMFVLGFYALLVLGNSFNSINKYIASLLLMILGSKMIKDAISEENQCDNSPCLGKGCKRNRCLQTGLYRFLSLKILLIYGTATSIDSFAAGVSFALINDAILMSSISIGVMTSILSFFGANWGFRLKKLIGNKADLIGGIILLILAVKAVL